MDKIAAMNRRITIKQYTQAKDDMGGNTKTLATTFIVWASVEQQSGSRSMDELQVQYREVYKIIKRHEVSRPLSQDNEIVYEDKTLSIHRIKQDKEGRVDFDVITAYLQ